MTDAHDHDNSTISDCTEALAEIYTFLDGELTDVKRTLIAAHLERCSPCIEAFDFEAELRTVISTKARSDEVPEMLRIRIAERLTLLARGEISPSDEDPSIGQPPALEA
jgi:mycothiol system anti-sigma-R factor